MNQEESLYGSFIVIDPGHSERKIGARGKNGVEEENLNRFQAEVVATILAGKGAKVEVVDPIDDDLVDIGKRACATDLFLSLHHNACNGKQHYVCVLVHKRLASKNSEKFASICAQRVAKRLSLPLFSEPGSMPGVMKANLAVLHAAENARPNGPCVLVESYFVDAFDDVAKAEAFTGMAGGAIAEAAEDWLRAGSTVDLSKP
jgi:N-acetylmuramoyl-L-alanine amidase